MFAAPRCWRWRWSPPLPFASPALAQTGGLAVGVIIEVPAEVTVGQSNASGRLVITNQTAGGVPVRVNQISLAPACRTLSLPCDAPDAGVFVLGANAVGTAGACIGVPFVVGTLGDGHYTFVPRARPWSCSLRDPRTAPARSHSISTSSACPRPPRNHRRRPCPPVPSPP